ncbi:integral membrane protein, YjbE family [Solimonas aquatica]|uniref:Integral membrane protein, YjbE family n=1 Tax=Solimonas aquatica TaxID=489703 RepID=A0A1H9LJ42_9GAMM|nr:TerC family protein [Solimonas aquatica]SER11532.1 integral membrane protein, YjbE family [Solimonas aquatica]
MSLSFFADLSLLTVAQIIAIDVLLGGDNAVVIALACRQLPEELRNRGIFWGVFGAIGLRVLMVFFALSLLALPFLKIIGSLLLLWIGIKLLIPQDEDAHEVSASTHLLGAIRTIIVADAVMSLDNVVAVAGAADGHLGLVALGILVSVPIIVWGSRLVLMLMDKLPLVVQLGAALLGWIAGDMWMDDEAVSHHTVNWPLWSTYASSAAGAALVLLGGRLLALRSRAASP